MPEVLDNIIVAAKPDPGTYSVKLTWANGESTVSDMSHLIGKGVFAALSDPRIFAQVRIGDRGRSIEWPGEIDLCADALWFETHPAEAPGQSRRTAAE
jgi:hypothetical protein